MSFCPESNLSNASWAFARARVLNFWKWGLLQAQFSSENDKCRGSSAEIGPTSTPLPPYFFGLDPVTPYPHSGYFMPTKSERLVVYVEPSLKALVQQQAAASGESIGIVVRRALRLMKFADEQAAKAGQ